MIFFKWSFFTLSLFFSCSLAAAPNFFGKSNNACYTYLSGFINLMPSHEDIKIFERSLVEPILSGSIKASPDYLTQRGNKGGKSIFPWSAYFLADLNRPVYSFPTNHLLSIQDDLRHIMNRRMAFFDTNYPLQVFFIAHDAEVFFPNFIASDWRHPFQVRSTNAMGFSGLHSSIKIKIGATEAIYKFENKSQVIVIGNGDGLMTNSGWDESFTLAHEIAHTNSFMVATSSLEQFEFLAEAVADFKGLLYSDKSSSVLGPIRNPESPHILSLDEIFMYKHHINPHEAGGFVAKGFWRVWKVIEKNDLPDFLVNSYMSRVVGLFTDPSSPWVDHDGKRISYKNLNKINKIDLQDILNFLASVSMQWMLERQLSVELVKEVGEIWENLGAIGPYRRYRSIDVDPDGVKSLDLLEREKYNSIDIPDSWPTIDALVNYY